MRNIRNIGPEATQSYQGRPPVSASDALSSKASGIAAAFQKTPPNAAPLSINRSYSGLASPSLSSQTASTLLQEQDITQLEQHSHGGGGGHGMKMLRSLEAEEAAGEEEVRQLRKRKKLSKPDLLKDVKQTDKSDKSDETDESVKNDEATSDTKSHSGVFLSDEDELNIWNWS